jgi:hypothetical protein
MNNGIEEGVFMKRTLFLIKFPLKPNPNKSRTQTSPKPHPNSLTLNTPILNLIRDENRASRQEALRLSASHSHSDGVAVLQLRRAHAEIAAKA